MLAAKAERVQTPWETSLKTLKFFKKSIDNLLQRCYNKSKIRGIRLRQYQVTSNSSKEEQRLIRPKQLLSIMRGSFNGRTPAEQEVNTGSNPVPRMS